MHVVIIHMYVYLKKCKSDDLIPVGVVRRDLVKGPKNKSRSAGELTR